MQTRAKRSLASRLSGHVPKKKKTGTVSVARGGDEGSGCLLQQAGPFDNSSSSSSSKETPQMDLWGGGGNADGGSWTTFPGDHSLPETVPVS